MRWAAGLSVVGVPANANPAKVLNLSLGGSGSCSATYQSAINAINAVGGIIAIAAGNSNTNASGFQPANCNGVVTVASTDRDGNRAFYSNFGTVVEISAPGGETNTSPAPQNGVLSTLNAGLTTPGAASYAYYQGTSMAAPHIAGILSLMVSISPTLNYTQSVQVLQDTAQAFPAGSNCSTSTCGAGIADAAAALFALANPGEPTPTATATQTGQPGPTATPTNAGRATRTPTVVQPTATFTPTGQPGPTATPTRTARASRTPTSQP
jgi:serine protease